MSTYSLRAYALGLFAFMLIKVLVPGYFARQDMKTPVRIGVIAIGANLLMKPLFVIPLVFFWGIGHVGLALTTALAAYINAFLLYRGLRQESIYIPSAGWAGLWLKYAVSNLSMVLVLLGFLFYWDQWLEWGTLDRIMKLAVICVAGLATYMACLWITGIRLRDFKHHH